MDGGQIDEFRLDINRRIRLIRKRRYQEVRRLNPEKRAHDEARRLERLAVLVQDPSWRERRNDNSADSRRRVYERWVAAGCCHHCGKVEPVSGATCCESCILKRMAKVNLGSTNRAPELRALLERHNYRCAYTGRKLEFNINLSFDHVVPRSQHDPFDISNLVPCDYVVNRAKGDMSVTEFKRLCRDVLGLNGDACLCVWTGEGEPT
jgi:hypothetical protein